MQPWRQLDVRYQGIAAAATGLALLVIVSLAGLHFTDRDSGPGIPTPTPFAALTPVITSDVAFGTPGATQPPSDGAATPTPAADSTAPPLQERDKWGQVIETITEDSQAQMYRSNGSRTGVYAGDAISRRPGVAWAASLNDENFSSPAILGNRVVIGGNDNSLKCLDVATGELIWEFDGGDDISSSPAIASNRVFFGSFDGNFYALDLKNGRRKWRFETADPIHSSPAVDGSIVYFGGYDRVVYALSILDGTIVWSAVTGDRIQSSPAVSGDLVVIGSDDGYVYGLDRLTGKRRWRVNTEAPVTSTPTIADGMVYFASSDGVVYGITADSGDVAWTYESGNDIAFSSTAISTNSVVFGTDGGNLIALRADNGREQWVFAASAEIRASPMIVDGVVYVGCYDENLYAIDLASGERLWSTDRGGAVGSPVYADGAIYISLNSGELQALRPE